MTPELEGLRVAFVAGTLGQGGAERQLYYMLRALVEAGAMPRVLCLTQGEHWEGPIRALGVEVRWVGQEGSRASRLRRIVADLRRDPVDVVQSQHFYANVYVAVSARLLGVPGIGAIRSDVLSEVKANPGWLGWACLRLPRVLAANSLNGVANAAARGVAARRLHLLPNAVDCEHFASGERTPGLATRLVTVGRLVPAKRHDRFLRLIHQLRDRLDQPICATIVGDGPGLVALREQARAAGLGSDVLRFEGSAGDVRPHLATADLFVLTSDWEGTPNVVLEAMAAGVPVVSTRVGGVTAILRDGEHGLLVDRDDEAALADAVLAIVRDPARGRALAERARQHVRAQHGLESLAGHLAALYEAAGVRRRLAAAPGARPNGVLHITDTLAVGGAERMACGLANGLAGRGYRVHLCTTRAGGPLASLLAPEVRWLDLGRRNRIDVRAIRELARYLVAHQIDIVHAHGTSVFIAAAAIALRPGARLVWHLHYGRLAEGRAGVAFRAVCSRVQRVVAASEPLAHWAVRRLGVPPEAVTYVPNFTVAGSAPNPLPPLPGSPARRVVCVANVTRDKDHATLLRAFALVARRVPDARLLLVGRGTTATGAAGLAAVVQQLQLEASVSMLGERDDVPQILAQCAVGVLASRSEGMPVALLEYAEAGLAVVSTAVGQCPEVLAHGAAGVLVSPGEPVELGAAIASLLEDGEQREALGQHLRARVRQRYSRDAALDTLEAAYGRGGQHA